MKNYWGLVAIAALSLAAVSQVKAADLTAAEKCSVRALLQGGGAWDGSRRGFSFNPDFTTTASFLEGFGEAGAQYVCGGWGLQVDGALYGLTSNNPTEHVLGVDFPLNDPINQVHGHAGGTLFTRDARRGMLGLAASYLLRRDKYDVPRTGQFFQYDENLLRLGVMGEYFLNDRLTLGGGAFYLNGNNTSLHHTPTRDFHGPDNPVTGVEGDIYAKVYPSAQLAFSLRGDVNHRHYGFDKISNDGVAATLEAEYLFDKSPVSAFAGGRYGHMQMAKDDGTGSMDQTDWQGFAGLRWAIGGPAPTSLRARDRTGVIDNTSVMLEKLPDGSIRYDEGD